MIPDMQRTSTTQKSQPRYFPYKMMLTQQSRIRFGAGVIFQGTNLSDVGVSLVAGGRLHACVAHDSYHSLGKIGTDGTCGVGSLSFFVSGWMEGQEVKDVAFLFSFGSVSLQSPQLSVVMW